MKAWATLLLLALVANPAWAGRAVVQWDRRSVNVRAAPDPEGERIDRLRNGSETEILEERGEWARVSYRGGQGWVVAKSLRRIADSPKADPKPPANPEPAPESRVATLPASSFPPEISEARRLSGVESPTPAPSGGGRAQADPAAGETGAGTKGGYLSQYTDQPSTPAADAGGGLIRMVSGLLLVLALIAAVVYMIRRFTGSRFLPRRGEGIRILATRPAGPRHGLLLVEAGGLVWLVAHGPDGLSLISEIRDQEALKRLNGRYGFLEAPFESELRRQLAEESGPLATGSAENDVRPPDLTPEERLAALRRRPKTGDAP